jgi:hypothetical protein
MVEWRDHDAHYTSASGRSYFGWEDLKYASPSRLADAFVERFPRLVREGAGSDWEYSGWYVEMLHRTHPDRLPVAYGDWLDTSRGLVCRGLADQIVIVRPPSGEGRNSPASA